MEIEDKHIETLLYSYFAGDLSDDEQKELLRWLEADDSHKKQLSELSDWWATAHAPLFTSNMKVDFNTYFSHLKESSDIPAKKIPLLNWNLWGKVVASVLLLVSVGTVSYWIGKSGQEQGLDQLAYFETTTPLGAQTKIVLPDQSVVWVNSGSTLKYATDFNKRNREIQLDGEAYFEVTRDSLKPFVVKSQKLAIKVLGTRFNVKAYQTDEVTDVTLVAGKVNVSMNDLGKHTGEVVLSPNRMLSYNKSTDCVKLSEVNAAESLAWMNGRIKFKDVSFESIAKDLERKYNVRIRIESAKLKKEIFSGSFTNEHTLDDILREVDVDHKYVWSRSGDEVIIRNK